jgi:hypothetical protein
VVGARGFEPRTSCAQGRRATRLRYAPTVTALFILKHFPRLLLIRPIVLTPDCTRTVHEWVIARDCEHWHRRQSVSGYRCRFVGSTVEFYQCFALPLQLHLRILLEDLRVALMEHLSHPLIGDPSGTQPCGISGSEIIDPKVFSVVWCPLGFRSLGNRNGPSREIDIWFLVLRTLGFDLLLLGPCDVVRSEQRFHGNWEFNARTRVRS